MSILDTSGNEPRPAEDLRQELLRQLRFAEFRPFHHQVVQSPWNPVVDVESLHRQQKRLIQEILGGCGDPEAVRCLTVIAPAGYGKTHLLAWTRQLLDERNDAVFIYVPPYTLDGQPFENHVLQATLEALHLRSLRQSRLFADTVRRLLVRCYDQIIKGRSRLKDLNVKNKFIRWLFPSRLKIGKKSEEYQLASLQKAFRRRGFFERAFTIFEELFSSPADGVRADWDTFVAACLLTCGNTQQRWHADRWFRNIFMPSEVLEEYHLLHPCQGHDKIRNGLYTLNRLVDQVFCLAFDQIEDTFTAARNRQNQRELAGISILLRNLSVLPHFSVLFMFQTSAWIGLHPLLPPMLVDRMIAGYGPQQLLPLDLQTASQVIQARMQRFVWDEMGLQNPLPEAPLFPFSEEDVNQIRIAASSELRSFLRLAQTRYVELLEVGPPPSPPPPQQRRSPIKLAKIEPSEVLAHEPTAVLITGNNLPPHVNVFFHDKRVEEVVCRPEKGEIEVTSPTGLGGAVKVWVEEAGVSKNVDSILIYYCVKEPKKPYSRHINRQRLREVREQLKLTQRQVCEAIKRPPNFLSLMETGQNYPPDEFFEKLAQVYNQPLCSFFNFTDGNNEAK